MILHLRPALVALGLVTCLQGCDALSPSLAEKPVSFLSEDQFFRTASDAVAATKAVYAPLSSTNYYGRFFSTYVILNADYADGRASYQPGGEFAYDVLTTQRIGSAWNEIYSDINRANLVIARVPEIEMDVKLQSQLVAEARFLRALDYYNLARMWGAVPLRTEPVTSLDESASPRVAVDEIYKLIVEDLTFAESNLPERYDAANVGRATRGAAKTLLADVYLTREQWSEAAAEAKEVIDSDVYSLVRVQTADDFLKIYGPDVVESSEEILSVKFGPNNNAFLFGFMNHPATGYVTGGSWALLGDLNSKVLSTWDPRDLRREFDLYSSNPADLALLKKLGVPELFRKYRDPTGSGSDFPLLRYPDALLIYAEASAMAADGPTSASYEAVNQVRRRGFGYDPDAPSPVDLAGLSPTAFRDAVLMERAWEFAVEGKRWFDLVRTHRALETIQGVGESISDKYLLWPIPQEEINTNGALTQADQNPGW